MFLLKRFSNLFSYTHEMYNIQQTTTVNIIYHSQKVNDITCQLQNDRQDDNIFQTLWFSAIAQTKEGNRAVD